MMILILLQRKLAAYKLSMAVEAAVHNKPVLAMRKSYMESGLAPGLAHRKLMLPTATMEKTAGGHAIPWSLAVPFRACRVCLIDCAGLGIY